MIKANELRIGNIIQDKIELETRLVVFKLEDGIITCGSEDFSYPYMADTLKGIPLTEKVLHECRCIRGNDEAMWRNPYGIWLTQIADSSRFYITGLRIGHSIGFLHELQNVTFCLTGEELFAWPVSKDLKVVR
jgi:hypothetical protein